MTINDGLIIFAMLIAPFLAVCAQSKINERKEKRNQKLWVFRTLMGTRGNKISLEHVQALNSIELFFSKKGKEKNVVEKWAEYLDHLAEAPREDDPNYQIKLNSWAAKSDDYLADLLSLMGKCLGYDFDKVTLKKGIYFPKGHGEVDLDNFVIRKGLMKIITGEWGLPVRQFVAQGGEGKGKDSAEKQ